MTRHILDLTDDFPVSLEVAREQRLELMEERKTFVVEHQKDLDKEFTFSLCEH